MTNDPPNSEKGDRPNPGLGTSAQPMVTPNTTGTSHTDLGASMPPYAPLTSGAPSGIGPMQIGATATSDQYPTAVEHLQTQTPATGYQSGPAGYSMPPGGASGAPDYSSSSQYPPDEKKYSFSTAPAQPGYSHPSHNPQGYSQPGYDTGSPYQSAITSPPAPVDQKQSPSYTASANPAFFSPDTVGNSHSSPSPAYTAPLIVRAIAIPQINLQPTSPLLAAYPPELLARGIPRDRWLAFLAHLSAILGATDAENSKAHRADVGREIGNIPTDFGKSVAGHATSIGRGLKKEARKGNLLGVTVGAIGGAIAWPVVTSLKVVGTVVTSPISIMQAVAKKPQKRHERAAVAAAEAGKGWLHERGYHASLMGTEELASVTGIEARRFVDAGHGGPADAAEKMRLMVERLELAEVEVQKGLGELEVGSSTLWLVLVPYSPDEA